MPPSIPASQVPGASVGVDLTTLATVRLPATSTIPPAERVTSKSVPAAGVMLMSPVV